MGILAELANKQYSSQQTGPRIQSSLNLVSPNFAQQVQSRNKPMGILGQLAYRQNNPLKTVEYQQYKPSLWETVKNFFTSIPNPIKASQNIGQDLSKKLFGPEIQLASAVMEEVKNPILTTNPFTEKGAIDKAIIKTVKQQGASIVGTLASAVPTKKLGMSEGINVLGEQVPTVIGTYNSYKSEGQGAIRAAFNTAIDHGLNLAMIYGALKSGRNAVSGDSAYAKQLDSIYKDYANKKQWDNRNVRTGIPIEQQTPTNVTTPINVRKVQTVNETPIKTITPLPPKRTLVPFNPTEIKVGDTVFNKDIGEFKVTNIKHEPLVVNKKLTVEPTIELTHTDGSVMGVKPEELTEFKKVQNNLRLPKITETKPVKQPLSTINEGGLTKLTNEPITQVSEPTVVGTEQPARPIVSTGGETVSGVARSIEAKAIENGLISKGYDKLAGYDSSTIKAQSEMISNMMKSDPARVERIATGEEQLPVGMKPATPLSVMEDYAMETKNGELALKLAKSPLTSQISEAGSELSLSRMRTPDSPVESIVQVNKRLEKSSGSKLRGKTTDVARAEIKTSLVKEITKIKPNKYDLINLLDQIVC